MSSFRASLRRIAQTQRRYAHTQAIPSSTTRSALIAAGTVATLLAYTYYRQPIYLDSSLHPAEAASVPVPEEGKGLRLIAASEVKEHNSRESCWVVLNNQIWDVTEFLDIHPGGANVVLSKAGKDATNVFKSLHPPNTLRDNLDPSKHLGTLDPATASELHDEIEGPSEAELTAERRSQLGPLTSMINLEDFAKAAKWVLGEDSQAYAYYASAADDEQAMGRNRAAFNYLNLLPRILVPVTNVSTSTTFLGKEVSLPIFIAPAALARLGHPDGEINLTKGASSYSGVQCISSNASCSLDELFQARNESEKDGQKTRLWFQLYVNRDRKKSEGVVRKALEGGCDAIVLTVDAPVGGKRERDLRAKAVKAYARKLYAAAVSGAQFSYLDADLAWKDIAWLKSIAPETPILLKGISSTEDVDLAHKYGCNGVILSNHGGRQLDAAPAPLATLIKLRKQASFEARDKEGFEIYIDGGIRRATDVVKALCCGAKGVALGRPFLYAQSCYGEEGVKRVYDIMQEEMSLTMRLLGVTAVKDLGPQHVELLDGLLAKPLL